MPKTVEPKLYNWLIHLKPISVEAESEEDALFDAMARCGFDFRVEKVERYGE